jgi:hypothetical protein
LKLIYDRQSVGRSVLVSGAHLVPATNFSFSFKFSFRQLRVRYFVEPSLTRGCVCNLLLQLLLDLARAITLESKSDISHNHILLSHLRLLQSRGPGYRIYIPQEQGGPVIPQALGSLFVVSYDSQGLRWRHCNPPPHG